MTDLSSEEHKRKAAKEKPLEENFYKLLTLKRGLYSAEVQRAITVVEKYVKREKRIMVGGTAIDMALRLKGSSIYDEDELADYDFYTPEHFNDAYEIALWLVRTKYPYVTAINGMHPTTMRVRVAFEEVADVTYVPRNIYDKLPTLEYRGFRVIHPNFQIINQHRALSKPFENPPRETVLGSRWKKDMERHDILYAKYPLERWAASGRPSMREHRLPTIKDTMVGGMAAFIYWLQQAKAEGFKCDRDYGKWSYPSCTMTGPLALYTYDSTLLREHYKDRGLVEHNPLLNFLPRSHRGKDIELFTIHDDIRTGKDIGCCFMANLQLLMMYFLTKLVILRDTNEDYYEGYLTMRAMTKWAGEKVRDGVASKVAMDLLPSVVPFGNHENLSEAVLIRRFFFEHRNERLPPLQPKQLQTYTVVRNNIPDSMRRFDYRKSWIFAIDGEPVGKDENTTAERVGEQVEDDGRVLGGGDLEEYLSQVLLDRGP